MVTKMPYTFQNAVKEYHAGELFTVHLVCCKVCRRIVYSFEQDLVQAHNDVRADGWIFVPVINAWVCNLCASVFSITKLIEMTSDKPLIISAPTGFEDSTNIDPKMNKKKGE